jgi:hypothetical protein
MSPVSRRAAIPLTLVALAVAAGLGLWIAAEAPLRSDQPPARTQDTTWAVGEQRVYSLRLSSHVTFGSRDLLSVDLEAKLTATRVAGPGLELARGVAKTRATLSVVAQR